jgi:hypothetical protein
VKGQSKMFVIVGSCGASSVLYRFRQLKFVLVQKQFGLFQTTHKDSYVGATTLNHYDTQHCDTQHNYT